MKYVLAIACISLALLVTTALHAQQDPRAAKNKPVMRTGLSRHRFSTTLEKKLSLPYLLYLPEHYGRGKDQLPLILFLHGAGERGNINAVKNFGPVRVAGEQKGFPFIVLAPVCPKGKWWSDVDVTLGVMALLEETLQKYHVDPDRVYLTGLSMGGFGTWHLAEQYPDRWAAIAPVCGGGNPYLARRITHLPVRIYHGKQDKRVPVGLSMQMAGVLKQLGGNVELLVYPDLGHFCWKRTYDNPQLYQWFLRHSRKNNPGA